MCCPREIVQKYEAIKNKSYDRQTDWGQTERLRAEAEPPRNPFSGKRASQVCKNALNNTRLWKSAARTKLKIGKPKTKPKSQNYKH